MLIEQAEALGEPPEDPLLLFSVLYAFWVANYVAFNGDVCRDLAAQFLALAEKQRATVPLMIGHRLMGFLAVYGGHRGRPGAPGSGDRALRSCRASSAGDAIWPDVGVAILSFRSLALWLLGYPEAALRDADDALKNAREMGQAATLMYALGHATIPYTLCGNYAAAAAQAQELVALAEEKGSLFWKAFGMMNQGSVLALTGRASDAIEMLISGIAAFRTTGATFWMPFYLPHLARAHAELGQFEEAWRCIGEAMTAVETTKEKWCEAEVHRMAGEIALMSPRAGRGESGSVFRARARGCARAAGKVLGAARGDEHWRGCGAIRANGSRPAIFSRRSTAGSPKASTRAILKRPRRCSTSWREPSSRSLAGHEDAFPRAEAERPLSVQSRELRGDAGQGARRADSGRSAKAR